MNKPNVLWSQKSKTIKFVIDIVNAKEETLKIDLSDSKLNFTAEGQASIESTQTFSFQLEFHKKVDPLKYKVQVKERSIKLVIAKANDCEGEWGRICPTKHRWLKFDVDSVELTDEETIAARKLADARTRLEAQHGPIPEEAKIQQLSDMLNVDDISKDLEAAEKEMYDMMRNSYLTIYNGVVGLGYIYVFFVSILRLLIEPSVAQAIRGNYKSIGWLLKSCQHTVFLEILHSYFGLVKSPVLVTATQILGRAVVLFGVLDQEESLQTSLFAYVLMVAWSGIEVLRYPYYITQIYELFLPYLMWLRYNAWVIMYPLGIISELFLVYHGIQLTASSDRWSVHLPNYFNFSFNFSYYLCVHFIAIAIAGVSMMNYMKGQRIKAMKKLNRLNSMKEVYDCQVDLLKIRKKKSKSK